jgi:outer membrane receptor protein involved in Fe transport
LFSSTTGFHFATNIAGGRQRSTGIFGQDIFRLPGKWMIIAGVRWDDWSNFDGGTVRIATSTGFAAGTNFADRRDTGFNPRLSLLRDVSQHASIYVSGYRAFRAPTLNELYRSFRQGPVTTLSNALLRAERSTGAEAGTRLVGFDNKLAARATVFWTDIIDPVTNVTLDPVTRQRQNLGRTRSLGTELDARFRLSSSIELSGGYQYTHATVVDSVPSLIGLNVPEVPRHQFSWEARYWNPSRLLVSVQGRYSSLQYDDDLNTLPLKPYYVTDVFVGRNLKRGITVYVAAENLLNQRYAVTLQPPTPTQTRPLENLGPPVLARVGIRVDWPARRN